MTTPAPAPTPAPKRLGDMTIDEAVDWVLWRVALVWAAVQIWHWIGTL